MNGRAAVTMAALLVLAVPAGAMAQAVTEVVPGAPAVASEDETLWNMAQQRGTADAYRSYLSSFPQGAFAPTARFRLGQLLAGSQPIVGTPLPPANQPAAPATPAPVTPAPVTPAPALPAGQSPADASRAEVSGSVPSAPPQSAPAIESALALTLEDRRAIQSRLSALGHDTRGIDGTFGSGTRLAIRDWQAGRGESATGFLTAAQARDLRTGSVAPLPSPSTPSSPPTMVGATAATEAALELTSTQRRIIQSRLTQLGHDTRGIDGAFGSGTRRAITAWQQKKGVPATGFLTRADADALMNAGTTPITPPATNTDAAARAELALNLSSKDRQDAQRGLMAAGHDTRGADGTFGSGTRRAIRDWQAGRGAPVTGYLTADQFRLLAGRPSAEPTPPTMPKLDAGASAEDEAALNLGPTERTEVQTRLSVLGYDPNGIDGKFGPGARRAIKSWQGDNGLAATGYLNADQLAKLRGQRRS